MSLSLDKIHVLRKYSTALSTTAGGRALSPKIAEAPQVWLRPSTDLGVSCLVPLSRISDNVSSMIKLCHKLAVVRGEGGMVAQQIDLLKFPSTLDGTETR